MDLELRHLRVIVAIADELSFSRAADRLGMPQPALSSQLARIEKALGVCLFDRTTRSVWPTAATEALLPAARSAVVAVRDFEDGARALRTDPVPELRVAADASLVGALSGVLRRADPGLRTVYSVSETALAAVPAGAADLAWGYEYPTRPFRPTRLVRSATVGTDPLWVALPPHHRLAGEPVVALADLAGEGWASGPAGADSRDHLVELCHEAGFRPDIRYVTAAQGVVPDLVGAGACVALASPITPAGGAVHLAPLRPDASRRIVLAWHPARCPTSLAEAVHCRLRARYQRLMADYANCRTTSSATAVMPAKVG